MGGWFVAVRNAFVNFAVFAHALSLIASLIIWWFVPIFQIEKFITNSTPDIPGVTFALFGFAITAVSIMASLKGAPFFSALQTHSPVGWNALISGFIHVSFIYAIFGLFTIIFSSQDIIKEFPLPLIGKSWPVLAYIYLFISSSLLTYRAILILRLIVQAPLIVGPTHPPVNNPFTPNGQSSGSTP